jgi:hypothetical protein
MMTSGSIAAAFTASLMAIIPALLATPVAAGGTTDLDAIEARFGQHVGEVLDLVELGTGARFVRPRLEALTHSRGELTGIRITPEGAGAAKAIRLASISRVMADRETIYEAQPAEGRQVTSARRQRERYEKEQQQSAQRMAAHGIEPWPRLSSDEHAAEVVELEQFVKQVQQSFPGLTMTATHEFLVATDIPAAQMGPFVANLDAMHDFLCSLYGIPRGEPVWKGKCLVVAFLREDDFWAFEERFMNTRAQGVHGLCHQRSDGRVIMACHRGNDVPAFAHMLVHETSHGFNHRWLSPARIPSWLNEGIAEWVGTQVVPMSNQVPLKESVALATMRATGRVDDGFFADGDAKISAVQYGIASSLVRFLVTRDRTKFAAFVRAVKEGTPVEEALKTTYRASLNELLLAYGRVIGVPALAP